MRSKLCKFAPLLCILLFYAFAIFTACKDEETGSETYYSYDASGGSAFLDAESSLESESGVNDMGDGENEQASSELDSTESENEQPSSELDSAEPENEQSSSELDSTEPENENSTSSAPEDTESSFDEEVDNGETEGGILVEHIFVNDGKSPNCTETGFYKEWCRICGVVNVEETYPALGHISKTVSGFAPNCYTEGQSEWEYCSVCNTILKEPTIIPKVDHDYYLGACQWCDLSLLRYDIRKYEDGSITRYYAVCLGAEIFTPYSAVRFVEIPAEITYTDVSTNVTYVCPVTEIDDRAFLEHYELNSLIIGKNVKKIGEFAFGRCYNLREVYDKSEMRVGELDVLENGFITDYVKSEDIHYEEYTSKISVDEESGCIMYSDNDVTELIGIRDVKAHVIIPEGVTKINAYVFYKTRVAYKLTIASTVNWIDRRAFYYECDTHPKDATEAKEGHRPEDCDIHIKEIVMLNTNGWRVYVDYDNPTAFIGLHPEQLNYEYQRAWDLLVVDYYEYYWIRGE